MVIGVQYVVLDLDQKMQHSLVINWVTEHINAMVLYNSLGE